jgi:P4 family phage/plasmid primase-like protien
MPNGTPPPCDATPDELAACTHVWRSDDRDFPCTPLDEGQPHTDGTVYVRLRLWDGTEPYAPADRLFTKQQIAEMDAEALTPAEPAMPNSAEEPPTAPDQEEPPPRETEHDQFVLPIQFSENALAYQFSTATADTLVYVHGWGKWMRWNGCLWVEDHAIHVFDTAREICAQAGEAARRTLGNSGVKVAAVINKASCVAAIERLSRHHHRQVREADVFDANPWMINCPDLSVDLMEAITPAIAHRREDYMTRTTNVAPDFEADCPIWKAFLSKVMGADQRMVDYLKRVCGYMLTGTVREHTMLFGYGPGGNGKTTFSTVLLEILGVGPTGYAAVAPISTFTANQNEQHPTDLAMLRGVRCVVAQETEEGRAWATSKLKMMTGGDQITARFMRQDFFTYTPQFKVLILGNHKPLLRHIDEAMRRRLHLIPFTVTIPKDERDPLLPEKLRSEYGAILAWMVEGCLAWQRGGLQPPDQVIDATENYLAGEDSIGAWMAERCLLGKPYYGLLIDLFPSWKAWAEANGEWVGQRKQFAKLLDTRPELVRREQPLTKRAGWIGLDVKPIGTYP